MILNDYLGLIGFSGVSLGLGFTIIGLIANAYFLLKKDMTVGWISRVILFLQLICLSAAVISLAGLLLNNAFEYPLVFDSVEKSMPWWQKFSGLWSGQSSSLLFWSFILSLVIVFISGLSQRLINKRFSALVSIILGMALLFFLVPVLVLSNPFEKLWQLMDGSTITAVFPPEGAGLIVPVDGVGMNPSLRHIAMLLHPPFLYFGLVGFFSPFAVSMASLIQGDRENKWVNLLLPVSLAAWICLTLGMVLGSWWAYTILGWGGYWGWDAVEITGLLPWLLSFGLIHSLRMQKSGKDYLRWIVAFSGLIFISILSGILITRSGILESVHAYSTGVMGPILSIFIGINSIIYFYFVSRQWRSLKNASAQRRLSIYDYLIRIFNFLILSLVLLYFVGQTYPLTSQIISGTQISWTAQQYEIYSAPLLFLVLLTTAICPVADLFESNRKMFWRKLIVLLAFSFVFTLILVFQKNKKFLEGVGFWAAIFLIVSWTDSLISQILFLLRKNKNDPGKKGRYLNFGSIFIHIGLGVMALGIMGQETLSDSYELRLAKGEDAAISDFVIRINNSSQFISPEGTTISVLGLSLSENAQNNMILTPNLEYYPKMQMVYSRPAINTNLNRDIQVILKNWQDEKDSRFEIYVSKNPLMVWIWIGGILMSIGGLLILVQPGKLSPENKI